MDEKDTCKHHWLYPERPTNSHYPAECKLCGEKKNFPVYKEAGFTKYPPTADIRQAIVEWADRFWWASRLTDFRVVRAVRRSVKGSRG